MALYSTLNNVYAMDDTFNLNLKQGGDWIIQQSLFKQQTHDHYVSTFLFCSIGMEIDCAIKAPGSMHDPCIAAQGDLWDQHEHHNDRVEEKSSVHCIFEKSPYLGQYMHSK